MNDSKVIADYCAKFHAEHEERYQNSIPDADAAAWMAENVPHFSCDDAALTETYYFRWWTFRKHLRIIPNGKIITEFLPDVPWSGPYNAISCPVAHHISEGRWLADSSFVKEDIRFFLQEVHLENTVRYSNPLIYTAWLFCRRTNDVAFMQEIFPQLERLYRKLRTEHGTDCGLYWSNDGRDGMEYSVSGSGLRPTLNSYLYGAAVALADFCRTLGKDGAEAYEADAAELRQKLHQLLWDEKDGFFKTVPMDTRESAADFARDCADRNVLEEIGYIPWGFEGLTEPGQDIAFRYLTDPAHFRAPWGITTADQAHPLFMKNPVRHECLWDGPVWPYATAQTLTGIYSVLLSRGSRCISGADYMALLKDYARAHQRFEGGKRINWIDENLDPFSGQWISRELILMDHHYADAFPPERGADYNHSTFCDLVLSGACGISVDRGTIRVAPLAKGTWTHFAVTNLAVGNERFEVYYDENGTHYGFGSGITLCKNGAVVAKDAEKIVYSY